jgi:hypothetical protein
MIANLVKKALKNLNQLVQGWFGMCWINNTFTSINTFINAIVIYAFDTFICVGQYLAPSYTEPAGDQVNI